MLYLYKDYLIFNIMNATKKLTQQYVDFILIIEKVEKLTYQFNIFFN